MKAKRGDEKILEISGTEFSRYYKVMNKKVLVLLEVENHRLSLHSSALIHKAGQLADRLGGQLSAVLIGPGLEEPLSFTGSYEVDRVFHFSSETLTHYTPEIYSHLLSCLVLEYDPAFLLSEASSLCIDLMPRVAARLGAPLITNCLEIEVQEEVKFFKAIQKGRLRAAIVARRSGLKMATISPDVLRASEIGTFQKTAPVEELPLNQHDVTDNIVYKAFVKADHRTIDITEAQFVLAIGKGIGAKERFLLYQRLADQIGAALGATRPVVDIGLLPFERQIGQTGKEIAPRLIIMCGISGASEFSKGIEGAGTKVAINIDEKAAVFKDAELGIVADLDELLPKLIEHIDRHIPEDV